MSEKPEPGGDDDKGVDDDTRAKPAPDADGGDANLEPSDDDAKSPDDDVRAKMREALERKHERERAGEAHLQGHEKAHGVHGKSGGPRDFRRKTGP